MHIVRILFYPYQSITNDDRASESLRLLSPPRAQARTGSPHRCCLGLDLGGFRAEGVIALPRR